MLLEAAGRNQHSHSPLRRHINGGSDFGWQVPLKKRIASRIIQKGDNDSSDKGNKSDNGDDVYKNEDDKSKSSKMIVSDRASKKNDTDLLGKLAKNIEEGKTIEPKKRTSPLRPSCIRSLSRSTDKSTAKVNELQVKQLKHQDPEANHKVGEASRSSSPRHVSFKPKPFYSTTLGKSSSAKRVSFKPKPFYSTTLGKSSSARHVSFKPKPLYSTTLSKSSSDNEMSDKGVSFEDIKKITIRRSQLAKWFLEPFFEELIIGCFVRVGIGRSKSGPIYRLCMVKNVDATVHDRQYKFENKTTHKYLNLVWGSETSAARWKMAMVSDSPPLEEEFKQWMKEVERTRGQVPMKPEVEEKREAIQKVSLFVYSAATVKQMLQEKKCASSRPVNIAAEKDRLKTKLKVAFSKHNKVEVEKIKTRLQELDASRQAKEKDVKALRLNEMNKKNRIENFRNAYESQSTKSSFKLGDADYDPLTRRWTRPKNYYTAKEVDKEAEDENNSVNDAKQVETVGATAVALEAAADAGKLKGTSARVDEGTKSNLVHNLELPISLAKLQNLGGAKGARAGLLAKRQRIEATMTFQMLQNDGGKRGLTLTISDYKRKRRLL